MFPSVNSLDVTTRLVCKANTSFDDKALLVKSLQHVVKHFSTRLEYMRRKSCIYFTVQEMVSARNFERYLSFLNNFGHMCLLSCVETREIHG